MIAARGHLEYLLNHQCQRSLFGSKLYLGYILPQSSTKIKRPQNVNGAFWPATGKNSIYAFPGKLLFRGREIFASTNHLPVKYIKFMLKMILIIFRQGQ